MWPEPGVTLLPAAALLLLYPHQGAWWIPLTVRRSGLRHHGGQVSLPGGRLDHQDETVEQAALREANEEIGVLAGDVEIIGRLTSLPIAVSGHLLSPVVGLATHRPRFALAGSEVERLIEVRVETLMRADSVLWEERVRPRPPHDVMRVPYFEIDGAQVWGATAMVLAELVALLDG
jgi:8-oxo-dGTP pyrophosphatase MutT (NUDIX family)